MDVSSLRIAYRSGEGINKFALIHSVTLANGKTLSEKSMEKVSAGILHPRLALDELLQEEVLAVEHGVRELADPIAED